MKIKIGLGYDIHRLVEGRKLILGGVEIPWQKGLLGHSDADVLLHAISDALLGAIGEKSIGDFFPDNVPETKNISSIKILQYVVDLIYQRGWTISNIDAVLIVEQPKLSPFIERIRNKISQIAGVAIEDVNVKAKTNEGMGMIGNGEAIAALANVLIMSQ